MQRAADVGRLPQGRAPLFERIAVSRRFLRHNIMGAEVGRPRPIAYLQAGGPRRRRPGRWRRTLWLTAGAILLVLALYPLALL